MFIISINSVDICWTFIACTAREWNTIPMFMFTYKFKMVIHRLIIGLVRPIYVGILRMSVKIYFLGKRVENINILNE